MRIVRGRAEARLFPSRHDHGLFRLVAYLRLRQAAARPEDGIHFIDRHQSAAETWTVLLWVSLTLTAYVAAAGFAHWPLLLAIPVAAIIALVALQIFLVLLGISVTPLWLRMTRARTQPFRVNNILTFSVMTAASAFFAVRPAWTRFVAWQFFGVLALNAIAAAIVFLLRDSIAALEASVGGSASEQ